MVTRLAGTEKNKKSSRNKSLKIFDQIFSLILLAPAVVGYWRGTCNLLDIFLYPENELISSWISYFIGIIGHLIFTIFQKNIKNVLNPEKSKILYYIGSRLYTIVFAFICVNSFRGIWQLLEFYTDYDIQTVSISILITVTSLGLLRGIRSIASPYFLVTDCYSNYFEIPTRFMGTKNPALNILDCLFSVIFMESLVVVFWRSIWAFEDLIFFPENDLFTILGSLAIGVSIILVTFGIQPVIRKLCSRINGFWRILLADLFLLFASLGSINVWRSIWLYYNVYFLEDNELLSNSITHGVSIVLLLVLNCSNSLLVCGVRADGEESDGTCIDFDASQQSYLSIFCNKEEQMNKEELEPNTKPLLDELSVVIVKETSQILLN